jgi:SagB-type dehydrogenase family enzyme
MGSGRQLHEIELPQPDLTGTISLEAALARRRSVRGYGPGGLTVKQVGQLLWAGQGITDPYGLRTAPSAGALYPLRLYLVATRVEGLEQGVFRYVAAGHGLILTGGGDRRHKLYEAGMWQESLLYAPAILVVVAVYARTTRKYGARGIRYVHMEVGHVCQNIYLQATALGLGTVAIGAFWEDKLRSALDLAAEEEPQCLMPVGPLP